jgi:hypothetical protein
MISGAGAGGETVEITLRLKADGGNMQVSKQIADQVQGVAQQAQRAFDATSQKLVNGANGHVRVHADVSTKIQRIEQDLAQRIERIRSDSAHRGIDAVADAERKIRRLKEDTATATARIQQDADAKASQAAQSRLQRDQQHSEREASRAEREAARGERQDYTRERGLMRQDILLERHHHRAIHGYLRVGEAAVQAGKGMALTLGANEKNLEQLAQTFAKWQGITDLLGGAIHAYMAIGDLLILQKRETQALFVAEHLLNQERAAGAALEAGAGAGGFAGGIFRRGGGRAGGQVAGAAAGAGESEVAGAGLGATILPFAAIVGTAVSGILAAKAALDYARSSYPSFNANVTKFLNGAPRVGDEPPKRSAAMEQTGIGPLLDYWTGGYSPRGASLTEQDYAKANEMGQAQFAQRLEREKAREELSARLREGTTGLFRNAQRGWANSELSVAQGHYSYLLGRAVEDPNDPRWQAQLRQQDALVHRARAARENPDAEELREARGRMGKVQARVDALGRDGKPIGEGDARSRYEELGRSQEKVAEIQRRMLDSRRQETAEMYSQVDAAHKLVEAEKKKLEDRQVSFGKMDPGRQQAVLGILRKMQAGGKLSDSEADLLDESGMGDQTRAHWLSRAAKADPTGVLRNTIGKGIDVASKEEDRASKELAAAKQRELEATRSLAKLMEDIVSNQGKIQHFYNVGESIKAEREALAELEKSLAKRDQTFHDDLRALAARIWAGQR